MAQEPQCLTPDKCAIPHGWLRAFCAKCQTLKAREEARELRVIESYKAKRQALKQAGKAAVLLAALLPATAHAPPPYAPYVQPSPYAPHAYPRSALPAWVPPTVPAGDPSLRIPNPPAPPYQPQPWTGARP